MRRHFQKSIKILIFFLELLAFSFMMKDVRKYFLTVSHKLIDKVLNGQRNALASHGLSDIFSSSDE